jgi:phosphatidylinositol alpha-1,6-mannosyltransferase
MKNVAIITGHFPPCKGGGIAEWALGIARELPKIGYQTSVYATNRKDRDLTVHKDESFSCVTMYGRNWHEFHKWYSMYYMWKILNKNPETIFIATTWGMAKSYSYLKKKYPLSKMIVVAHGLEVTRLKEGKELTAFKNVVNDSDLILCVSKYTKNEIIDRVDGIETNHIKFLPNGVDINRFFPVENTSGFLNRYNIPENSNIILTLARIIRRKGHDTVIKCLPRLIKKFPNIQYVIAGPHRKKDTYLDELKLLAKELSVENHIVFVDYIPDSDLNEIYSRSQVYVMVSRTYNDIGDSEGFGITFLEANACGCPVIGSTEGGIPDAVENNKNGLLVPADDIKSLTKAIEKFFEDESFRRKIIDQGIERVNNDFTWEKLTIKMVKYLIDIKN